MSIFIGLLTFVLMVIALFLILLVLVQLPKKDAGVGMAFGAGMSEMLLGAGSGNVLTRITKYTVGIFLGLSLLLSVLISSEARKGETGVARAIEEQARSLPATPATPAPTQPTGASGLQSLRAVPTDPAAGAEGTLPLQLTPGPAESAPTQAIPPAPPE
ncbi:MAG: preprotein translocase subunit SecG [Verrucomicrobiae bacterium]|nr:preprotein translocase subunit SecG [Verrucomicrobiae bacterium]